MFVQIIMASYFYHINEPVYGSLMVLLVGLNLVYTAVKICVTAWGS